MFQKNEKIVEIETVKQNPIFDTEMFSLFFEGQKSTDIDNCQIVENNSSIAYLSQKPSDWLKIVTSLEISDQRALLKAY